MAFNPFTSFRKYQKFWMAILTIVAMVTFVLCSGLGQGDLGDRIIRAFGFRKGPMLAKAGGSEFYEFELRQLKTQRTVANDALRKCVEASLNSMRERRKEMAAEKVKEEQKGDREKAL